MKRAIVIVIAVLVAALGTAYWLISPPRQLTLLDGAMGGGSGAERVAEGVPFGTHGQTLDVWVPAGASKTDKLPVLVFWYGGGWVAGDRAAYGFAARPFARAGYLVVVPDYRKVPQVRFPAFLEDGAEAVAWTRDNVARLGGDPDRIAFAGHSAGAYEAIMLALDPQWLEGAGVDPAIVKAAIGLSGPYDFYPFTSQRAIDAMAQAPDPLTTQPITFARADAPPLLLITSTADTVVKPRNSFALEEKLRALGAPVEVKNYPGLTHEEVVMALSKPFRGKGPVLADSLAFLKAHDGAGE